MTALSTWYSSIVQVVNYSTDSGKMEDLVTMLLCSIFVKFYLPFVTCIAKILSTEILNLKIFSLTEKAMLKLLILDRAEGCIQNSLLR